ncbi:MAG TPA: hypothetical protein VFL14_09195 [Xanthomonadales bacterium]|nr:hypothetical protein [Xanthomonadales bacterium]
MALRFRAASLFIAMMIAVLPSAPVAAQSATFLVGGDTCDFATIQPALDAAAAHPGPDVIRVALNGSYTAQALRMQAQDVVVVGGFATCASTSPTPGARTTISGAGGVADSVLVILGAGDRTLRNLVISGGDETDGGKGGGIDFEGTGSLRLEAVTLIQNRAGLGGGINFAGTAPATLRIGADVIVQNNVASGSGGGIRIEGDSVMLMRDPGTTVTGNEALGTLPDSGYGGGIEILEDSVAQVASGGVGNSGVVSFNRAKYGGGIAMAPSESDFTESKLLMFTTEPQRPVRVNDNVATVAGGGIYVGALNDFDDTNRGRLCAYEFRIDHNRAPEGAALWFGSEDELGFWASSTGRFNVADIVECDVPTLPLPAPSVACAPGVPCNSIDANVAQQANGQPAPGAIVYMEPTTSLVASRTSFVRNTGNDLVLGRLSPSDADGTRSDFEACLIADNTLVARVMATELGALRNCTVAGNAIGFGSAFLMTRTAIVLDAIVWQPGTATLDAGVGFVGGGSVITNDPASFPSFIGGVVDRVPRFVDAARSDYRPRAASPAVDAAIATPDTDADIDLLGAPRDVDLPLPVNGAGPRDIGAYERQAVAPLVLNDTFEGDLNLWAEATAGVTAFDADNFAGGAGSGSQKIDWNNTPVVSSRVTGRVQCVHLPGPGTYRLNGAAHTSGSLPPITVQTAALAWEFRRDGGESCNAGPADRSADFNVTTGAAWVLPATPAPIVVLPGEWTPNSSISVTTVVKASGTAAPPRLQAWFDGVQLALDVAPQDPVFRNGFE